jgi:tetratricopeptide (TPR) repeat protein
MKRHLWIVVFWSCLNCFGQRQSAAIFLDSATRKDSLGDYISAIADYNKAIELDPKNARAYFIRGLAKLSLNENDGACLDWSKAGELGFGEAYDMIQKHCQ